MSGRQLTPRSSLESLKKEAKRWLQSLRDNVAEARDRLARAVASVPASPTLRDVQHALAREFGFQGWAALKDHLGKTAPPQGVARYERMATNLLDAYRTGTPEAMQRHWADTWHRRAWEPMRRYVQLDLGLRAESAEGEGPEGGAQIDITLDHARKWIARSNGFESWEALATHVAALPADQSSLAKNPVFAFNGSTVGENRTEVVRSRDWNVVFDALENRQATGFAATGQLTDEMAARLARYDHITALHLGGTKALTEQGFRHLARLTQLRELDLGGSGIGDRHLEFLAELPHLEVLNLSGTGVTDAGITHVARCERLRRVDLGGTATGDGAIRVLAGKPVTHFFTGHGVTDAGLSALHDLPVFKKWQGGESELALASAESSPNHLMLRGAINDRSMARLAGLDGLFGLNIEDSKLGLSAAALPPLVSLPHLGFFGFDATDEAMPHIARMPALQFLMCQDTSAGDEGFVALSKSRTVEYIWGRRCHNLRSRGFAAMADMPALRSLSVSCLNVKDDGLSALPRFPSLRELMPMDVQDEGYRFIGQCGKLESLVLMYCRQTGDRATEHIAGLDGLKKYFASYTRITDRTPQVLASMKGLESVDLGGCPGVTNAGVAAFRTAPSLKVLGLSGMQNVTREAVEGFPPQIRVTFSI